MHMFYKVQYILQNIRTNYLRLFLQKTKFGLKKAESSKKMIFVQVLIKRVDKSFYLDFTNC